MNNIAYSSDKPWSESESNVFTSDMESDSMSESERVNEELSNKDLDKMDMDELIDVMEKNENVGINNYGVERAMDQESSRLRESKEFLEIVIIDLYTSNSTNMLQLANQVVRRHRGVIHLTRVNNENYFYVHFLGFASRIPYDSEYFDSIKKST